MISQDEAKAQAPPNIGLPDLVILTTAELYDLLEDAISLMFEYRDSHGRDEEEAGRCAKQEVLEGIRAEHELHAHGECARTRMLLKTHPSVVFATPMMIAALKDTEAVLSHRRVLSMASAADCVALQSVRNAIRAAEPFSVSPCLRGEERASGGAS